MPEQPQQLTPEQQQALQEKLKNMSPEELREFQKQQCIFCQIVEGKIPSKKIIDGEIMGILDINPAAKGHILLLPREHYAIMPQVPDKLLGEMFVMTKKLSQIQLKALKVSGTTLFIANGMAAGQKAQHFMMHLIPRRDTDEILPDEEKVIDASEREKVVPLIEKRFNQLMGLKKDVVKVGKKAEEEEKIVEAEFEETEEEPTAPPPVAHPWKKANKGTKKTTKTKKTVKKAKTKTKKKKKEKITEDGYQEASLDDIANLFK